MGAPVYIAFVQQALMRCACAIYLVYYYYYYEFPFYISYSQLYPLFVNFMVTIVLLWVCLIIIIIKTDTICTACVYICIAGSVSQLAS